MSMAGQIEPGEPWLDSRSTTNVWMLGRLKAGVSRMQAEASLNRIAKQLAREYPSTAEGMTIELSTPGLVGKALRGPITAFAGVLKAVAALVLLLGSGFRSLGTNTLEVVSQIFTSWNQMAEWLRRVDGARAAA